MTNLGARIVTFGLMACVPFTASSQGGYGVISGTVFGPSGETVPDLPIQATHAASGEYERTRSAANGEYMLTTLAAGSYTVTISILCCTYESYKNEEIVVAAGETTSLEIQLEGMGNDYFVTFGDYSDPLAAAIRKKQEIPDLPVPRLPDGKPDLSGMWLVGKDPYPQSADAHPWAAEIVAERKANGAAELPSRRCLPYKPPIPSIVPPHLGKFVHSEDLLVILFEGVPGFRQVFLDGRQHPDEPNPSWLGHSIGHWDGEVLVVDTVGYNDRGWMMGNYPQTEELHLIERYRRTAYGRIELEVSAEDPTVFKVPWIQNLPLDLAPQEELIEYICENDQWGN